jgi:Holliday junction resolvase RusA-like endonuclease
MDDNDIIYFEIPGQPRPQPRHRATKHGSLYIPTDAPIRAYKDAIRLAAMAAGLQPHAEAVFITQHFIFARPASHINAAGEVKRGAKGWPRGDVDNYEKALWDALKGSAFTDDDQIVQAASAKAYAPPGEPSRTRVWIRRAQT